MPSVADCFRQHAAAYLQRHGDAIPLGHRKVIDAIRRCRTGELGHVLYQCERCPQRHWLGRSCGNRHCANCQHAKSSRWFEKQQARLLPTHYFLVTFTVPEELRSLLRCYQHEGYTAIFDCGADSMRAVAGASKYLRDCELGFFGALHTWGRDFTVYHPHVHFVVPGGGVHRESGRWHETPENFFLHGKTLARVYKAKFADRLRALGLYDQVPRSAWKKPWTVDIQPVGRGGGALKYLAAYVSRVAISNKRIVACDEQSVTYRYTPSGKQCSKQRTVAGTELLRGFLQHVLPRGFQKLRYYGWLSPNSRLAVEEVRWLIWLARDEAIFLQPHEPPRATDQATLLCKKCGGLMHVAVVTDQHGKVLYQRPPPTTPTLRDTG